MKLTGIGSYLPFKKLTNSDLEKIVDTNDEWIIQRTGIQKRHVARDDEFTSDLAVNAVMEMQEKFKLEVKDVDFILLGTSTPDFFFPSTAAIVQSKLGIEKCGVLDISAACAGWAYGLVLANGLILSKMAKKVLVIGAETLTKTIDYSDRTTCILFGDGASAAMVEKSDNTSSFYGFNYGSDGSNGDILYRNAVSNKMNGIDIFSDGKVHQDGRKVFRWAVENVKNEVNLLCAKSKISLAEIDWFVPHSANLRIIEKICDAIEFPLEKTLTSVEDFGNTSTASIPIAIAKAYNNNRIKKGDKILAYGFGGGMVHAGCIFEWTA